MKKTVSIFLAIMMMLFVAPLTLAAEETCTHPGSTVAECKVCNGDGMVGTLTVGEDYAVVCETKNELEYAKFVPDASGLYSFYSFGSIDVGGSDDDDDDLIIGDGDPDGGDDWNGDLDFGDGDDFGWSDFSLSFDDEDPDGDDWNGDLDLGGDEDTDDDQIIESDPYFCLYDEEMNLIAENDNYEGQYDGGWFGDLSNDFYREVELEAGKTYYVGVGDKNLDNSEIEYRVEKVFKIDHQPTADEPYVDLTCEDKDATYQWYLVKETRVEITDENAALIDETAQTPYNAENGWTPVIDLFEGTASFFNIDLQAGDVVEVEFSGSVEEARLDPTGIIIGPGTGDDSVDWGDIGGSDDDDITIDNGDPDGGDDEWFGDDDWDVGDDSTDWGELGRNTRIIIGDGFDDDEDSIGWGDIVGGTPEDSDTVKKITLTVANTSNYDLVAYGANGDTTAKAYLNSKEYTVVDGENEATLKNPVADKAYVCFVTLSDNTVLRSDSFIVVCTHENAEDDGDCTTVVVCPDCGETTVEANEKHTGGTATCTEQAKCDVCGKAYGDLAAHNTDGYVESKVATCTETGVVGGTYCTVCNYGKEAAEAELPLADHNQDGVVAHEDATCSEAGVVGGTYCSACGEGKEAAEAEIPTVAHNTDGVVAHKDASCTETGVVGGTYCTACNYGKEAAEEVIPLAAHTEKIMPAKKATCKVTGLTEGVKCSVCGEILVPQEVIPLSTEHTMKTINHRDPTCSVVGIVGGDYCAICRMGFEEARTQIPKVPHTEDIIIPGKPATCKETGLTDGYKCSVCNKITTKQEEIPLGDHNTDGVIKHKEPTCYTVGTVGGNFCTVCRYGREEALATIPAKGHNSDGYIEHKDATCTENGVVGGTYCTDCTDGLDKANKVIPAAHTPGEAVKENITPATCAKNETYELVTYCTVCGEEASRQLTTGPKLPHTEVIIAGKPATCKETGLTEGKMCSVCGEILVAQQSIPLAEHKYENGTCTECGAINNCSHICHSDNCFICFIMKIVNFFKKLYVSIFFWLANAM